MRTFFSVADKKHLPEKQLKPLNFRCSFEDLFAFIAANISSKNQFSLYNGTNRYLRRNQKYYFARQVNGAARTNSFY